MADDRDYTRDENPHQGASHSFGKNIGRSDAERSIETGRETRNTNATSAPADAPARGTGSKAFTVMRRMADDMDRLFENFGLGRAFGLGAPGSVWRRRFGRGSSGLAPRGRDVPPRRQARRARRPARSDEG